MKVNSFDLEMMGFLIVSEEILQKSFFLDKESPSIDNVLLQISYSGNSSVFELSLVDPFSLQHLKTLCLKLIFNANDSFSIEINEIFLKGVFSFPKEVGIFKSLLPFL